MRSGQKVRVRPTSPVAREWRIPPGSLGTVVCSYELMAGRARRERVDVRFSPGPMIWGSPAEEYEVIGESAEHANGG